MFKIPPASPNLQDHRMFLKDFRERETLATIYYWILYLLNIIITISWVIPVKKNRISISETYQWEKIGSLIQWSRCCSVSPIINAFSSCASLDHSTIETRRDDLCQKKIDCLIKFRAKWRALEYTSSAMHAGWFASRRRVPTETAVALLSYSSDDRGRVCGRACQHRDAAVAAVAVAWRSTTPREQLARRRRREFCVHVMRDRRPAVYPSVDWRRLTMRRTTGTTATSTTTTTAIPGVSKRKTFRLVVVEKTRCSPAIDPFHPFVCASCGAAQRTGNRASRTSIMLGTICAMMVNGMEGGSARSRGKW